MKLCDEDKGWRLALDEDAAVQLIQIDFRVGLFISDKSGKARLYIGSCFTINAPPERHVLIPEDTPSLGPVLKLFNVKVIGIYIKDTGGLIAEFENEVSIEVNPDDTYEAWQLSGSPGFRLVCAPGGSVVVIQDHPG